MSLSGLPPLLRRDRLLLGCVSRAVPAPERADWLRSWAAELWWRRHAAPGRPNRAWLTDLSAGLIRDALWLRFASWERLLRGTAPLCLLALAAPCVAALLLALCLCGSWIALGARVAGGAAHFLFACPLVLFVVTATAEKRPAATRRLRPVGRRLARKAFFAGKSLGVLLLAYLLGFDLTSPLASLYPATCDYLQMLLFVLLAICGLRWAFQDQEMRCKTCLRSLAGPSRVGRPSHNLLEWSGTEFACTQGHGLLSVPELETSWHQTSRWVTDTGS